MKSDLPSPPGKSVYLGDIQMAAGRALSAAGWFGSSCGTRPGGPAACIDSCQRPTRISTFSLSKYGFQKVKNVLLTQVWGEDEAEILSNPFTSSQGDGRTSSDGPQRSGDSPPIRKDFLRQDAESETRCPVPQRSPVMTCPVVLSAGRIAPVSPRNSRPASVELHGS